MDKENEFESNIIKTPPPSLIPAKNKSSVKKVRFSLVDEPFPTFDKMLEERDVEFPQESPEARKSVSDPLASALAGGKVPARSIWDTPTSSGRSSVVSRLSSPTRRAQTPNFERNMLKFSVMGETHSLFDNQEKEGSILPVTVEPRPVLEDDPMLLSGTSIARSARRLSALEDMESELLNSADKDDVSDFPNSEKSNFSKSAVTLETQLEQIATEEDLAELCDALFAIDPELDDSPSCWEVISRQKSVTCPEILNVVSQQFASIETTLDSAIFQVKSIPPLETKITEMENWRESFLKNFESARAEAILAAKKAQIAVFENMVENLGQTMPVFEQLATNWDTDKLVRLGAELDEIAANLAVEKKLLESQFEAKFHVTESGEIARKRSLEEAKLDAVDRSIVSAEAGIKALVEEIVLIEGEIEKDQERFNSDFKALREFYFANGWHVVTDKEFLLVFSVCWLFVFQKNDRNLIRLEKIIPAKNCKLENVFDEDFVVGEVLTASGLEFGSPFPVECLKDCMHAATSKLAEWTRLGQTLFSIVGDLRSLVSINSLNQIEVILLVENTGLPLMVQLVWFDPIGTQISFANFSFIISDFVQKLFPGLKTTVETALANVDGDTEQLSYFADVLATIHSVVKTFRNPI